MHFKGEQAHRVLIRACVYRFFAVVCAQSCLAQHPPPAERTEVWKTVRIGTFRSVIDLREALDASDCGIATPVQRASHRGRGTIPCKLGNSASEIIGRPEFGLSRSPQEIQLALVSGKDLGFPFDSQPSLRQLYERAESLGYALCPPEIGAQLRLHYTDQKIGEFLNVAMQPIRDYAGNLTIFSLGNGGAGLLLVGNSGDPDLEISASVYFVFVRPLLPPNRELLPINSDDEIMKRIIDEPAGQQ